MRGLFLRLLTLTLTLLRSLAHGQTPAAAKAPTPAAADLTAARAALRKSHTAQLRKRDPAAQRALGRDLAQLATKAGAGSAQRFVALEAALTAGSKGMDPVGMRTALEQLWREFAEVDTGKRAAVAVKAFPRKAPPHLRVACSDFALHYAGDAVFAGDAASARALLAAAKRLAAAAKLRGLDARIKAFTALARAADKLRAAAKRARTTLDKKPGDAKATQVLARVAVAFLDTSAVAKPDQAKGDAFWARAEKERDPFVRARHYAAALRHYAAVPATIKTRAWRGRIALRDDFAKAGPLDPALATLAKAAGDPKKRGAAPAWHQAVRPGPEVTFVPGRSYVAVLTTNLGTMRLRLLADSAPKHVASFAWLAAGGYYDGLGFHRIITDFMAQGGCCLGDGAGNPSYRLDTLKVDGVQFTEKGTLALANEDKPNTEGAQFFVTFGPMPHLNGKHTILGHLVAGMQTLDAIAKAGSKGGKPTREVKIVRLRVGVE